MEELLDLTAGHPEIEVAAGDVVVEAGTEARDLFVLVRGRLVVRRDGRDFVAIDAPGACVGEVGVLLGRPHTATVVATEPSTVRVVAEARAAFLDDSSMLRSVATLLAGRLDLVNRYLDDLQRQYADHDGGLGMVGEVLASLAAHHGDELAPGSEREPDPLY